MPEFRPLPAILSPAYARSDTVETAGTFVRLAGGLGILPALTVVLLLLLPYLVNTDRLRTRIVDELSRQQISLVSCFVSISRILR